MNLTWQIVKKDFQRLWIPLALWALLLAAKVALGWTLLEDSSIKMVSANVEQVWFIRMRLYSYLFIALDILVNYILAGVLIQEDALLGAQLFWRTRPISGARLLGAKLLGAALMFGAVPVLVWLPWWLHCSYGPEQIASAVMEVLFWQLVVTLPALLLATVTDQFGRFLLWTLVLFGSTWAMLALVASIFSGRWPDENLHLTRVVVATVVIVAGFTLVVAQQFLSRRLKSSVALTVMTIGLALLIFFRWPWDGSSLLWPKPAEKPPGIAANVTVAVGPARLNEKFGLNDLKNEFAFLVVPVELRGVPENIGSEEILQAEQTWRWSDGVELVRPGGALHPHLERLASWKVLGLPLEKFNPELFREPILSFAPGTNERRKARGLPPLPQSSPADDLLSKDAPLEVFTNVPRSFVARMRKEAPEDSLSLHLRLSRAEKEFELPVAQSIRMAHDAATLRVAEVRTFGSQMAVKISESWSDAISIFAILRIPDFVPEPNYGRGEYALVNRSKGNLSEREHTTPLNRLRIGTVMITRATLRFEPANDLRDGVWINDPNWFGGVTLAKVVYVEVANFTREVKVDKFELAP